MELKDKFDDARKAHRILDQQVRNEASAASSAVWEKYADELRASLKSMIAAKQALDDHICATASHPWEGRKVFREVNIPNTWRSGVMRKERVEGFVEVVRRDTVFAKNMSNYNEPPFGEVIIRKVKKDGTPSLAIHNIRDIKLWSLAE